MPDLSMIEEVIRSYVPEPTIEQFHYSDAFVRGLMGPYGSGKSVGCVMEIISRAAEQVPNSQGVRCSRWAIVRNTYPELETTTIKTWQFWVPDIVCPVVWSHPIRGHMVMPLADGTVIDLEVYFIALDKPQHVKKLLSLELTGCWINEAREVPKEILDGVTGRVGRFPPALDGGSSWSGVILDTNPPDDDHWWYRLFEEERPATYEIYKQPPAIQKSADGKTWVPHPKCENWRNHSLGYNYWLRQVEGKDEEWIRVYLCGEYGRVRTGKPVYPEYRDSVHASPDALQAYQNVSLLLGWDFGLTPACIVGQLSPRGQLRILREHVAMDMGIRQFARTIVLPAIGREFPGFTVSSHGDPAGTGRAQTDERTCMDELKAAGIPTQPAPTNSFLARREAVAGFLTRMPDGLPGFLMDPSVRILRKGFISGYHYERVQVAGEERYKDQPCKNSFSHPHDGLQYLALAAQGGGGVAVKSRARARTINRRSAGGWT